MKTRTCVRCGKFTNIVSHGQCHLCWSGRQDGIHQCACCGIEHSGRTPFCPDCRTTGNFALFGYKQVGRQ